MNELIKIDNDRQTVSGRSLHEFLEIETRYNDWFHRMVEYGFIEGMDFYSILSESTGGRPGTDHQLTIDMAKEVCMIQRTERGKQARQYFIEVEKAWNSPEAIMARALKMADRKLQQLQSQVVVLLPKAEQFDKFISGENYQDMNTVAKAIGWGRNKLFAELRERKILMRDNKPYQEYIDRGYFVVKEKPIDMGGFTFNKPQTYVTPKGVDYLSRLLNGQGQKEDKLCVNSGH